MYPSKNSKYEGIFVKEQIDFLVKKYNIHYQVYVINGIKSKISYLKSIFQINYYLIWTKIDIIHIHFGLSGLFLLINPFIKTPVIITFHGSDIQSYKKVGLIQILSRLVAKCCDKVIILNDEMFSILRKEQSKLVKIPCGVEVRNFSIERRNLINKCFLIGFPSDPKRPEKNFKLFLTIINHLKQIGCNIEYLTFKSLTRDQVVNTFSRLDCLIMTSLSEGSPQIIKEAMACRVPIISSNVGDVELLLKKVNNCFLVRSFEPIDFVNCVLKLMNLKPVERVTNGREKILELGLDQRSVCSKIFNLYNSTLDGKRIQ